MSVAIFAVCLGVLGLAVYAVLGPLSRTPLDHRSHLGRIADALETNTVDNGLNLERRLTAMEEGLDALPRKWDEINDKAKSHYERARHHVRRTKAELEARGFTDPEIDSLDGELRLIHGGGGEDEGVRAVHEDVVRPQAPIEPTEIDHIALGNERKFGGH